MQTKWLLKTKKHLKGATYAVCCILLTLILFTSCTKAKDNTIVIWTNDYSVVSYVELFNYTHTDVKAVAVYKEQPARSLPPAKDEEAPDIIIGPWLKNSTTRKYFSPLDYMFNEYSISKSSFYEQLIDYGVINEKQYLLPVSFNLPAIVFSTKNEDIVGSSHLLTLDQIKEIAGAYNKKNKADTFTAIGYAPSWDSNFLYLATKLNNANYSEKGTSFSYDLDAINSTIQYLKDWTIENNTDTTIESNFQFKYLYMPAYRQVSSDRCLFTYMASNDFFTLSNEQSSGLSFRWITQNNKIPVEDNLITMGLYKKSQHVPQAEKFIQWFFMEENQKQMLERIASMNIDSKSFGISGGFSSIQSVNEQIFPSFYRQLLGNVPSQKHIAIQNILPSHWQIIKEKVIIPFLVDSTKTNNEEEQKSLEQRILEWNRQYF